MNPLDIATETLTSKTREIAQITTEYAARPSANINPLSMLLKGVIDAAVMGGISNYEKVSRANVILRLDMVFIILQLWVMSALVWTFEGQIIVSRF